MQADSVSFVTADATDLDVQSHQLSVSSRYLVISRCSYSDWRLLVHSLASESHSADVAVAWGSYRHSAASELPLKSAAASPGCDVAVIFFGWHPRVQLG